MAGCTLKYDGRRGVTWSIKFTDASGRQVRERLGRADEGWTKRKASAALRSRLTEVEKQGYRRPEAITFETFAREWLDDYPASKGLKRSTVRGYRQIVEGHLLPTFGTLQCNEITVERIEKLLAAKQRAGLSAATRNRILNVLSLILRRALRRGLIIINPIPLIDRPREDRRRWRIFTPAEVVAVEHALDALIAEAENDRDRDDRRVVRMMFLALMGTGVRRGEALGLHWRSVFLADPDGAHLRIESTWVRDAQDTPKSAAGTRTIALGERLADELFMHRAVSAYSGDDDRVFANPRTGCPFNPRRYRDILSLALGRAGIEDYVRPCHDLRHSSITNAAAAGTKPEALMSRAGHASYATTRRYIDLAGEQFREEADRLEQRLWGTPVRKSGTKKNRQRRRVPTKPAETA